MPAALDAPAEFHMEAAFVIPLSRILSALLAGIDTIIDLLKAI
jgi:hypothetical protein